MIKKVFRADLPLSVLDLGSMNVTELTCPPSEVRRTPRLTRHAHPRLCSVVFAQYGGVRVTQVGREAVLGARDFALCDGSRPFGVRPAGRGRATVVRAHVPRMMLPLSAPEIDRLLVTRLSGQEGTGALFTRFLSGVAADCDSYRPADVARLSAVGLDLLAAALAHHADTDAQAPDESVRRGLLLSVEAFVREHLHDPDLSARTVAAAHHISVSYLHRLFRARGTTVAALIRRHRLEGARRDLTDPRLREVPVHQIAARWGFKGHAAFTRTFRTAYDIVPSHYRRRALGLPA
ncbi:helix-turn-helix domain-containing protein [Streptomyces sp. NPDC127072]|uniref:helix-turn-helix domain-containing protein n=1 Tax=Streptomyces sp. NPDC127072 TaxID=3347129 RepID=UPI003659685E